MPAPRPPIKPMLAKGVGDSVPATGKGGEALLYEPKWDGFRCLIFKNTADPYSSGSNVVLQSRSGEDLAYAFPEIVAAAATLPDDIVLDGELVVADRGRLWFERLQTRLRPRSEAGGWKIAALRDEHPASYVAFDLLAREGVNLMDRSTAERRRELETLTLAHPLHVTPMTTSPVKAAEWFKAFEGAGLDGVVAKPAASSYEPGKRTMLKVKHVRSVDVVVAGWRAHKMPGPDGQPVVGSLLLGLYDDAGSGGPHDSATPRTLQSVGVASSFSQQRRIELAHELEPLALEAGQEHPWSRWGSSPHAGDRVPGAPSRWSAGKDLSFRLLRPELVAEVKYDHMEGQRFRHVTTLLRFRPDRTPESCTYSQLDRPIGFDLADLISGLDRRQA